MTAAISVTISVLALCVSAVTAWLTLFRRGTVKMTQPTVIFFGPDNPRSRDEPPLPKVFLRTLLFATSKRGRIVESMHVSLSRNEAQQNFSIWVYGEERLVRGSGLFVGETGIAVNHHFLAPRDGSSFRFIEGRYRMDVLRSCWETETGRCYLTDSRGLTRGRCPACRFGFWPIFRLGARLMRATCRMLIGDRLSQMKTLLNY